MKKYFLALIPFVVCSTLALIYGSLEPKDFPDPTYPYRTPEMLQYLSSRWFLIGGVLSILAFVLIAIEDISNLIEKKVWRRGRRKVNNT
jgi:hypothetical protein